MTTNVHNLNPSLPDGPDDHGPLPPELAAIAAMLEALAEHERRSARLGFEERLAGATLPASLPGLPPELAPVAAGAESLALAERAGASPALEDRIFMATRRLLRPDARPAPAVVVVRRTAMRWGAPLAAAATLALSVGAWMALRPATPTDNAVALDGENGTGTEPGVDDTDDGLGGFEIVRVSMGNSTADRLEDISADVEALSENVGGEWFQLGRLLSEEAM